MTQASKYRKLSMAPGRIRVTKRYLDGIEDGRPVSLTFHFWSGQQVQYTVQRDGTVVTGSAS